MIPILYEAKIKDFQNNGIGRLSDAVLCDVTEVRNGLFELEMQYPVDGAYFNELTISAQIMAKPAPGRENQVFRIYKISKPLKGIVTIRAEHVSYQLSHIPVTPFTASNAGAALSGLKENAAEACPFEVWTDKGTESAFSVTEPSSFRSRLGGSGGSVLDVYGGEFEFDNYVVKLHAARGADNGVTLRYGKNITDLKQEEYISNTITGIYPYWKGEDALVTLSEKIISAANAEKFPYPRTIPLDMTSYFDEQPTEEALRAVAKKYVEQNALGVPTVAITVSFVNLAETEEYKDIAPLETVSLCDTVTVEYPKLGVSASAKVVEAVFDVLQEKYKKLQIGSVRPSLEKTLADQQKDISERPSVSAMQQAINHATRLITGAKGGYIILHQDGNGIPFEILIMDTPDIATAKNVWRLNQAGWGHSNEGYDGPYEMAATMDNGFIADFIKAGTLQGVRIIAESGTIGGWEIGKEAIYKDIVDTSDPDIIHRVYFQPPVLSLKDPGNTWILSCQKSEDGGTTFKGTFILFADGSVSHGNTFIDAEGSARFGNTRISSNGEIKSFNPVTGSFDFGLTRLATGEPSIYLDGDIEVNGIAAEQISSIGGVKKPKTTTIQAGNYTLTFTSGLLTDVGLG